MPRQQQSPLALDTLKLPPISHPWTSISEKPEGAEIAFLQKALKLQPVQVKVLNWLKAVCGERFQYLNGKNRESATLTVTLPPEYHDQAETVLVSLGFEKQGTSPWSNQWRASLNDEYPEATLTKDKGEIDIRRLPYKAPKEAPGRKASIEEESGQDADQDDSPGAAA